MFRQDRVADRDLVAQPSEFGFGEGHEQGTDLQSIGGVDHRIEVVESGRRVHARFSAVMLAANVARLYSNRT